MQKPIQKRSQATQDRILEVARNLFDDLGQDAVTTDMIAEKSNVAKGTIFAHFTDRANLIAAVSLPDLDQIIASIPKPDSPTASLCDRFMIAYETLLEFFARKPEFADLFVHQSLYSAGPWSAKFTEKCLDFEKYLASEIQAHQPQSPETAQFLVSGAQAFFLQVVTYQHAGWLDYDAACAQLRKYLDRWFAQN